MSKDVEKKKRDSELTDEEILEEIIILDEKLNDTERIFVRKFLATNNVHDSGVAAGLSGTSLTVYVYEIKNRPYVKRLINLEKLRIFRKYLIKDEEILQSIAIIAKANLADYLKYETVQVVSGYGKDGTPLTVPRFILTYKDSSEIPYEVFGALKSVTKDKNGDPVITLWDKPAAILKYAEYSGLFKGDSSGDVVSRLLSDITVRGIELSLKVTKKDEIEEAEVIDE